MIDLISEMIHLRATMLRMADKVEGLAELPSITTVRHSAPALAEQIRQIVVAPRLIEACKR